MKKLKSIIFRYGIWVILVFIAAIAFSWLATCGIIKLITLCFGMDFKWSVATGIWLCLWLLGSVFGGSRK